MILELAMKHGRKGGACSVRSMLNVNLPRPGKLSVHPCPDELFVPIKADP